MERKKLRIERLETNKERQSKFSKRKVGLLRKAKELSTICDADLALLMFSPTGKPTLYIGQNKDLSSILQRLSALSLNDREDRRAYTMKLLKKMYPKYCEAQPDPVNILDRLEAGKVQQAQLQKLKESLKVKSKMLSDWKNPQDIEDLAKIKIMEDHLITQLTKVKGKKVQLQRENLQ